MRRVVQVIATCLMLQGCGLYAAAKHAELERAAETELPALNAQRDSGAITWTAWAGETEPYLPVLAGDMAKSLGADRRAIATAVDAKMITPDRGRYLVEIARADALRKQAQVEMIMNAIVASRPRPATSVYVPPAPVYTPVPIRSPSSVQTTCNRLGNSVICNSRSVD